MDWASPRPDRSGLIPRHLAPGRAELVDGAVAAHLADVADRLAVPVVAEMIGLDGWGDDVREERGDALPARVANTRIPSAGASPVWIIR